jgi:hypothetical protein
VDDGPQEVTAVAAANHLELVRTASHGAVMNRIDCGADAATVTSDAERRVGSDEMLNVQGEVGGSETSNIQGGIGGEC